MYRPIRWAKVVGAFRLTRLAAAVPPFLGRGCAVLATVPCLAAETLPLVPVLRATTVGNGNGNDDGVVAVALVEGAAAGVDDAHPVRTSAPNKDSTTAPVLMCNVAPLVWGRAVRGDLAGVIASHVRARDAPSGSCHHGSPAIFEKPCIRAGAALPEGVSCPPVTLNAQAVRSTTNRLILGYVSCLKT